VIVGLDETPHTCPGSLWPIWPRHPRPHRAHITRRPQQPIGEDQCGEANSTEASQLKTQHITAEEEGV